MQTYNVNLEWVASGTNLFLTFLYDQFDKPLETIICNTVGGETYYGKKTGSKRKADQPKKGRN